MRGRTRTARKGMRGLWRPDAVREERSVPELARLGQAPSFKFADGTARFRSQSCALATTPPSDCPSTLRGPSMKTTTCSLRARPLSLQILRAPRRSWPPAHERTINSPCVMDANSKISNACAVPRNVEVGTSAAGAQRTAVSDQYGRRNVKSKTPGLPQAVYPAIPPKIQLRRA